jgi:hypothetical protein
MVAAHGVEEVVTAFTVGVSVTAHGNNHEFSIGYLGTNGWRNRSAVKGVKYVGSAVMGQFPCLTDARYHHYLMRLNFKLDQRFIQCP